MDDKGKMNTKEAILEWIRGADPIVQGHIFRTGLIEYINSLPETDRYQIAEKVYEEYHTSKHSYKKTPTFGAWLDLLIQLEGK